MCRRLPCWRKSRARPSNASGRRHKNGINSRLGPRSTLGRGRRAKLFEASEEEKRRIKEESAAYRLKDEKDKFSSTSNAVEVQLSAATVGLVSKEEFARRKAALEGGGEVDAPPAEAAPKEKKKKKKGGGGLSFAFDDEDEGGEGEAVQLKKKPKPAVVAPEAPAPAPAAASTADTSTAAPPATSTPLPAGYTCIRSMGDFLEINCEVRPSASLAHSRVAGLASHAVTLDVKAPDRYDQVNAALCGTMRAVLGGASVAVDVVRGHKAPVKLLKVVGVATPDAAYHRLLLAKGRK